MLSLIRHARRRLFIILMVLACCNCFSAIASASSPSLVRVLPRGIQRGVKHEVTFFGERLSDTEEVLFYDQGFRVVEIKVVNHKKIRAIVHVDADCRLGEHMVQLRTRTGVSDYRILHVEAYPCIKEKEAENNRRENAQQIEPVFYSDDFPDGVGVTVSGIVNDEDHDWYSVEGSRDQRLTIEVVGTRLGDFCDSLLEIYDPEGKLLARVDDAILTGADPFVSIKLPVDGQYLIHLSDAAGRGSNNARYRMHVGNFPRPTVASPAVIRADTESEIAFLGDCFGPIKKTLKLTNEGLYQNSFQVSDQYGTSPTPVPLRLVSNDVQIVVEQEPNDKFRKLDVYQTLPFSVWGRMDKSNDLDSFGFDAIKGQKLRVETFGHRIGSDIDSTVRIRKSDGKVLASNSDAVGTDSLLTATIPKDGRYFVEVQNSNDRFGVNTHYQLDVFLDQPSITFGIREFQRYSQQRKQIAVPAGNRFAAVFTAKRSGFDGEFQLSGDQLPDSIHMDARPLPEGSNSMPVVFEADPFEQNINHSMTGDFTDSETHGCLIELRGDSVEASGDADFETVSGSFLNRAQLMRVQPGNMCLKYGVVNKLAVARLEPVPFRIELIPPAAPVSQKGRAKLKVVIERDEKFNDPITLRLPFRPPGISARPTISVKPNQNSVSYPIDANAKASTGTWPICVTATSPNDQGHMISTSLQDLEIVTPFVSVESEMITANPGESIVARCKLDVLRDFESKADVRLTQLPQDVTSEPQQVSSLDESVSFPIKVGENGLTGKNHSVNVQVTVVQNGHSIVFDAGRLVMRFSRAAETAELEEQPARAVENEAEEL